jgi:hypothetical protein
MSRVRNTNSEDMQKNCLDCDDRKLAMATARHQVNSNAMPVSIHHALFGVVLSPYTANQVDMHAESARSPTHMALAGVGLLGGDHGHLRLVFCRLDQTPRSVTWPNLSTYT